jgi:hypothetical protein
LVTDSKGSFSALPKRSGLLKCKLHLGQVLPEELWFRMCRWR